MASEKKASEGIALLSMYGDEDDEMDDLEEGEEEEDIRDQEIPPTASYTATLTEGDDFRVIAVEITTTRQDERGLNNSSTPNIPFDYGISSANGTPQRPHNSVNSDLNSVQIQKSRLTIVDYGHEEGAMSPEPEEGEIMATGRVTYGEQLHCSDGELGEKRSPGIARLPTPSTQTTPPQSVESINQLESEAMNDAVNELGCVNTEDTVMVSAEEHKDIDPLYKFLPPPLKVKCSEELQEKIKKFLALKKSTGRSFNSEVRNRKEYRNPDFLLHAVTYQSIDQIGSCFSKDVFDPHGYDKSDFYDEIEADLKREAERKEQERKKSQKLDFASGGIQPGNMVPTPKVGMPTTGSTAGAGSVLNVRSSSVDVTTRDGRQNKKSKWDKVDDDQRVSLVGGGQENLSALGGHTFLSAPKAGGGYSAFVQQKRKEAEDKRSSDRKLERRS